jgi:FixJ family two-component response regulator
MKALSLREEEVLGLIVQAHTAKEIGRMLGISDRTVERHSVNIREKLHARSIVDMVRIALTVRQPAPKAEVGAE